MGIERFGNSIQRGLYAIEFVLCTFIPFQPAIGSAPEILQEPPQLLPSSLAQQVRSHAAQSEHGKWHIPSAHRPLLTWLAHGTQQATYLLGFTFSRVEAYESDVEVDSGKQVPQWELPAWTMEENAIRHIDSFDRLAVG